MDSLQFSITPYSFNALALLLIGLAGWLYLVGLREKTTAIYSMMLVLAGFTLGMASWLANGIVFWGGALIPFTEACAVVSLAGVIVFAYSYPRTVNSLEARLARFCCPGRIRGLVRQPVFCRPVFGHPWNCFVGASSDFLELEPDHLSVALLVCLRRTLVAQSELQSGGWRASISAFWRPANRSVRLLRNFSFAVGVGMI